MKKTLAMLLTLVMLFSLCACSNNGTQTIDPSNSSQTTTNNAETSTGSTEKPTDGTEGAIGTTQAPPDEPTSVPTEEVTTAPADEPTTPPTQAPTETPTVPPTTCSHDWKEATCTTPRTCSRCYITDGNPTGHSYNKNTTASTCTEKGFTTYMCACGDTYVADYTNAAHTYSNHVCTSCGKMTENYQAYQNEHKVLTDEYNTDIAELQAEIDECNTDIIESQNVINNAYSEIATLSPTCPEWFRQPFITNWRDYGSSWDATQAAQKAWTQEYNRKCNLLNNTISRETTDIQALETRVTILNSSITIRTTQYNNDIQSLKVKYGIS